MHPGNQLFVRTLGEVSVSAGGEMLPLTGGREYALLVYLAWIRSRVTRESIADLLWPSGDRSRRLHSLSQLVYRLGRSLPRGILLATKSELALRSQLVTLDAYELRSAAEAGRYRDALELCTGEFLPEFVVRDAPAFDHWREQVSTELRRLTGIVLRELVPEFERTGEWVRLHGALDRLIEDNPGDLELHRRQIRALLLQGDRAEAHARHRRYAQRLATVEQRADVDQLTNEIEKYAEIPEPLRAVDPALRTRLLGRRVEQDTLRSELALALRGRSRFVEVIGTAGLGKSRLLEHFGRYCILHGVRVLAGRCHPGGRQLPYSGIESILMSLDGSDV
ncbi:MAG TPA: AAA family ATPase, partial [Edaphobacter sp.]|nr:AAA family ATPase [Edaphobacter sp.]